MPIGSGLSAQLGLALENVYGTGVTPTRFHEFNSADLKVEPGTLESRGSGQIVLRTGRSRRYARSAGGPIDLDFMNKGMGYLLKLMFGTSVVAQVGSTAEYTQTHTLPTSTGGAGVSATMQRGIPTVGGTVVPWTFTGCKMTQWELSNAVDGNLNLKATIDARPVSDHATSLAVASYPADLVPLAFLGAAVTLGGASADLRSISITHNRALATDRRFLGNSKKEPIANGEWQIGGTLDKEFEDTDLYDLFIAGTPAALVATWAYGEIGATGNPYKLEITIPEIRYDGETPSVSGSDIVTQRVPFKALYNGTDPIITAVYHTDDTAL